MGNGNVAAKNCSQYPSWIRPPDENPGSVHENPENKTVMKGGTVKVTLFQTIGKFASDLLDVALMYMYSPTHCGYGSGIAGPKGPSLYVGITSLFTSFGLIKTSKSGERQVSRRWPINFPCSTSGVSLPASGCGTMLATGYFSHERKSISERAQ